MSYAPGSANLGQRKRSSVNSLVVFRAKEKNSRIFEEFWGIFVVFRKTVSGFVQQAP